MKHSTEGIHLLRHLVAGGLKIFTVSQANVAASQLKINPGYVTQALHHLVKAGWIVRLKRGVYALSHDSGFGQAPHEFEVAMALVSPSAISHWTAMHHYHLTQQAPNIIFAITPTSSSIPRSTKGGMYHFVKIQEDYFFGIEKQWVGEAQVWITNPERTLLDGLMSPQHCGDFREVLHAFNMHGDRLNLKRIIQYALKLDQATAKRLGWVLERLGYSDADLKELLNLHIKGYRKLDPTGLTKGPYNKKWMIQENL